MHKTALRYVWITLIVLVLDRLTKSLIHYYFVPYKILPVAPGFNLTLAYNKGAAFSFLGGASGWQMWFLGGVALFVSIAILIWLYRLPLKERWLGVSLSLILGGALGNLSDRILYGHVIDFLQFYVGNLYWPSFNVADSAVCVGAVMLLLDAVFFRKKA